MSAFAQPRNLTPTYSPLHFPLSSPPLHIPPSLQSLETPNSKGFTFGLVRHSRHRTRQSVGDEEHVTHQQPADGESRRGSLSSVESLPFGTLSRPYDAAEFEQTVSRATTFLYIRSQALIKPVTILQKPTSVQRTASFLGSSRRPLTSSNLFLRRSSSMLSLTSEDETHRLPELSRTNSASTCVSSSSSRGMAPTTPYHSSYDPDIQVLSEEEEDTEENSPPPAFPTSKPLPTASHVVIHTRAPPALKRPGLTRRDTPIPACDLAMTEPMRHPSKSFTSSLTPPTQTPLLVPQQKEPVVEAAEKPKRPPFKRRDTPHPFPMAESSVVSFTAYTPAVADALERSEPLTITRTTKMPNFFSPSLKRSLQLSGGLKRLTLTTSDDEDDADLPSSTTTTKTTQETEAASPSSSFGSSPSFTSYAYSPPTSSSMMVLPPDERMMWPLSPASLKADDVDVDDEDDDGEFEWDQFDEAFIVGSPEMALEFRTFSSVLDGKVWVSV
ncbi:hypothetical protein QFC19_006217 [Naganishia cerealis]|uniref:Uncharacterized protein n=1 Tax=Naganishia cerealis TaxID=610337 RepID=A0ACC2VIQ9_9TREE|nr:hypothetical protein QFC19_006217 [Naganishia cerealis]